MFPSSRFHMPWNQRSAKTKLLLVSKSRQTNKYCETLYNDWFSSGIYPIQCPTLPGPYTHSGQTQLNAQQNSNPNPYNVIGYPILRPPFPRPGWDKWPISPPIGGPAQCTHLSACCSSSRSWQSPCKPTGCPLPPGCPGYGDTRHTGNMKKHGEKYRWWLGKCKLNVFLDRNLNT